MRVACPACDAAYEIPDHVLASGTRRLRCARCAHEWTPPPAAPDPAAPDASPPAAASGLIERAQRQEPVLSVPPPPSPPAATSETRLMPAAPDAPIETPLVASPPLTRDRLDDAADRSATGAVVAAWSASVAVLAILCVAAYVFRGTVQTAWPPSQVLYAALGLG